VQARGWISERTLGLTDVFEHAQQLVDRDDSDGWGPRVSGCVWRDG
jgi:hypothetical protein